MKKRREVYVDEHYVKMLNELVNAPTEVGGGFTINNRNRITEITIFPSTKNNVIEFNKNYDIEFHTHPHLSDDLSFVIINRIPSYADVASVMATGTEEIVFTKGYNFKIGIFDKKMLTRSKYMITRYATKHGWNEDDQFFRIEKYLKRRKIAIEKIVGKKKMSAINKTKLFRKMWLDEIQKYGIRVTRVTLNGGVMYV